MSLRQSYQRKEERHSPFHQEFLKNFFYFKRDIKKFCESSDSIKASDVKKALKDAFSNASELADYKEKLAG